MNPGLSEWAEDEVAEHDRPEPTSAGIVVPVGRGVGSEEDFKLIEGLAGMKVSKVIATIDEGEDEEAPIFQAVPGPHGKP